MRSNDSSADEHPSLSEDCTTCGHVYNWHMSHGARKCTAASGECGCSGFTMEPKGSASSSPDDKCTCGCTRTAHMGKPRGCLVHGFHEFVPAAGETAGEPEPYTAGWTDRLDPGCARPNGCTDKLKRHCGSSLDGCAFAAQLRGERLMPRDGPQAPSPRPPFLVAYATGSGALNELALPGEASVAVVDGSLVISHASGVLGIQHVRPLEMQ